MTRSKMVTQVRKQIAREIDDLCWRGAEGDECRTDPQDLRRCSTSAVLPSGTGRGSKSLIRPPEPEVVTAFPRGTTWHAVREGKLFLHEQNLGGAQGGAHHKEVAAEPPRPSLPPPTAAPPPRTGENADGPPAAWKCTLCTRTNESACSTCRTCGRPQCFVPREGASRRPGKESRSPQDMEDDEKARLVRFGKSTLKAEHDMKTCESIGQEIRAILQDVRSANK